MVAALQSRTYEYVTVHSKCEVDVCVHATKSPKNSIAYGNKSSSALSYSKH